MTKRFFLIFFSFIFLFSCEKDPDVILDNNAPYYNGVNDVLIRNYVNRVFIDLLGREPLDNEMLIEVDTLKKNDLSPSSRIALVQKLQTDTNFISGDSSYTHAYYHQFYNMTKVRMIEGASNEYLLDEMNNELQRAYSDSLSGDMIGYYSHTYKANRYKNVVDSERKYMNGEIDINQVYAYMLDNPVYDLINMNTFNFVNASFDNLFFRFPTSTEFEAGYNMIEYNTSEFLMHQAGQSKIDYINILLSSDEFYEGMIIYAYKTFLARDPSSIEKYNLMQFFSIDKNYQKIEQFIMSTDEYAHF